MPARPRRSLVGVLAALLIATSACADLEQSAASPADAGSGAAAGPVATAKPEKSEKAPKAKRGEPAAGRTSTSSPSGPPTKAKKQRKSQPQPLAGSAAAQLATLRVAGRAPMTGYARDRFGYAWLDADRNGCDTRNDILRRDLRPLTIKPNTQGCVVASGVLADPYTRQRIDFVRGDGYSVDIDHVVPIGNAWASGAARMDVKKRAAFANDPLNLLAVDAGANRQKSDSNAASWLPPNKAYRCAYVARQIAVKAKYRLAVTTSEKAQMARQLATCPGRAATPDVTDAPTRVDQKITDPGAPQEKSAAAPRPFVAQSGSGGGSVHYQNCDAARAAGAAPVHRGDPGYGSHLDRDGDGTGCE